MQGLASGETKAAVAGGVNVMLAAPTTARICLLQALSHVGRCRSFDAAGDGYGRGEGFTVALLRYASTMGQENQLCSRIWISGAGLIGNLLLHGSIWGSAIWKPHIYMHGE